MVLCFKSETPTTIIIIYVIYQLNKLTSKLGFYDTQLDEICVQIDELTATRSK